MLKKSLKYPHSPLWGDTTKGKLICLAQRLLLLPPLLLAEELQVQFNHENY